MTSSYRATGQASVRATPVSDMAPFGAWAPAELSVANAEDHASVSTRTPQPDMSVESDAAERAALLDEAYARGLDDGMRKGLVAGQSQFAEATAA